MSVGGRCLDQDMNTDAAALPTRVDDLGARELLARVAEAERVERAAARDKLELAMHWCVLHPATGDIPVAVWGDAGASRPVRLRREPRR